MPITVLIVNDDIEARKLAKFILEKMGFETIEADDGQEGYEVAKARQPNLIISDDFMPKVVGVEMLRKLKSDPVTAHIPCIMIFVSEIRPQDRSETEIIEDAWLTAPYSPIKFMSTVRMVLEQSGLL